jgi:hypothetical protein
LVQRSKVEEKISTILTFSLSPGFLSFLREKLSPFLYGKFQKKEQNTFLFLFLRVFSVFSENSSLHLAEEYGALIRVISWKFEPICSAWGPEVGGLLRIASDARTTDSRFGKVPGVCSEFFMKSASPDNKLLGRRKKTYRRISISGTKKGTDIFPLRHFFPLKVVK